MFTLVFATMIHMVCSVWLWMLIVIQNLGVYLSFGCSHALGSAFRMVCNEQRRIQKQIWRNAGCIGIVQTSCIFFVV